MRGGLVLVMVLAIPLLAIWTEHREKMSRLYLESQTRRGEELLAQMKALRMEIQALRDTTTQFDLSFDTTLQQLTSRVEALERRYRTVGSNTEESATIQQQL